MGSQSSKHVDSRSLAFFNEGHVAFTHRAFTKAMGYDDADMQRPLIGICNTYSEINNCNANLRPLADAVKRGVCKPAASPSNSRPSHSAKSTSTPLPCSTAIWRLWTRKR